MASIRQLMGNQALPLMLMGNQALLLIHQALPLIRQVVRQSLIQQVVDQEKERLRPIRLLHQRLRPIRLMHQLHAMRLMHQRQVMEVWLTRRRKWLVGVGAMERAGLRVCRVCRVSSVCRVWRVLTSSNCQMYSMRLREEEVCGEARQEKV